MALGGGNTLEWRPENLGKVPDLPEGPVRLSQAAQSSLQRLAKKEESCFFNQKRKV